VFEDCTASAASTDRSSHMYRVAPPRHRESGHRRGFSQHLLRDRNARSHPVDVQNPSSKFRLRAGINRSPPR
jgi:hypothetical protein